MDFYIKKATLIYFATNWKEVSSLVLLSESTKGVQLLKKLYIYF